MSRVVLLFEHCLVALVESRLEKVLEFLKTAFGPGLEEGQRVEEIREPVHRLLLYFPQHFLIIGPVHNCERAVASTYYSRGSRLIFYKCELTKTLAHIQNHSF